MIGNKETDKKAFDTHGGSESNLKYRDWNILEDLPEGWIIDKYCGSPLYGFVFCTNGKSILNGGKRALVRVKQKIRETQTHTETHIEIKPIKEKQVGESADTIDFPAKKINILARKKMINKLLNDIRVDLMVCEIEGWDKTEYIKEIRKLINSFDLSKKTNKNQFQGNLF
jgi:hypothetical protein